jgi:hypothetical protein
MCRLDSRLYPACLRTTNVTIERSRTNLQLDGLRRAQICSLCNKSAEGPNLYFVHNIYICNISMFTMLHHNCS